MVKILTAEAAATDDELVERFAREVRTLGEMAHPVVVQLWDSGTYEGRPYAVLEAIEGPTLREVIASGPVGVERALAWIVQLLDVVEALHGRGIEHRDIGDSERSSGGALGRTGTRACLCIGGTHLGARGPRHLR